MLNKRGRGLLGASESRVLKKIVGPIKDGEVKRLPYNRHFYTCTVKRIRCYGNDEDSQALVDRPLYRNDSEMPKNELIIITQRVKRE